MSTSLQLQDLRTFNQRSNVLTWDGSQNERGAGAEPESTCSHTCSPKRHKNPDTFSFTFYLVFRLLVINIKGPLGINNCNVNLVLSAQNTSYNSTLDWSPFPNPQDVRVGYSTWLLWTQSPRVFDHTLVSPYGGLVICLYWASLDMVHL